MSVITRFAPSPTGTLHTGSARTALFNYLFSRHHNGKFLLRIEDTDQERSTKEFEDSIIEDLKWLGLEWDGEVIYQLARSARHKEVAEKLVEKGEAYYCYTTAQEIEEFRVNNPYAKFQSIWRDKAKNEAPAGVAPAIRIKAPRDGKILINDLIQGQIEVECKELDDMVMLRSDGTPTYMLAVVVDDHDMNITHVIRGDDHLTNAFRQSLIYQAMGWQAPQFAHIPLIHDKEGKKLSKRKGAMGIKTYKELGYLSEAVINHLLRLGWSNGDKEIFSMEEAIALFNLDGVGKSPARFDLDKLNHINAHHLRHKDSNELFVMIKDKLPVNLSPAVEARIIKGMPGLKDRAHTLNELAKGAEIYIEKAAVPDDRSKQIITSGGQELVAELAPILAELKVWDNVSITKATEEFANAKQIKVSQMMQALRAVLLGTFASPAIFEVVTNLGKDEVMRRIGGQSVK